MLWPTHQRTRCAQHDGESGASARGLGELEGQVDCGHICAACTDGSKVACAVAHKNMTLVSEDGESVRSMCDAHIEGRNLSIIDAG